MFPEKGMFTLALEFKLMAPGQLLIKQVRELPQTAPRMVTPILLNEPTELVVCQGEQGDAFAYHRLKCLLAQETLNTKLDAAALAAPLQRNAVIDFAIDGFRQRLTGGPFGWPGYLFAAPRPGTQNDRWTPGAGVTFRLRTMMPTLVDAATSPVITPRDFLRNRCRRNVQAKRELLERGAGVLAKELQQVVHNCDGGKRAASIHAAPGRSAESFYGSTRVVPSKPKTVTVSRRP